MPDPSIPRAIEDREAFARTLAAAARHALLARLLLRRSRKRDRVAEYRFHDLSNRFTPSFLAAITPFRAPAGWSASNAA